MKKLFTQFKFRNYNRRHAFKVGKRNLNSRKKKRNKRRSYQKEDNRPPYRERILKSYSFIRAPKQFSFIKANEDMSIFISHLETNFQSRKKVFLNLKHIDFIDYSAITVLLSVVYEFKSNNIGFNGNTPKNEAANTLLRNSGFFSALFGKVGKKVNYSIGQKNQMFTRANKKVVPELGLLINLEASQTIWQQKKVFKGLTRVLLELMQNTNNHADLNARGSRRWWLSVNHNSKDRKVSFVFVDYGVGVFQSLRNKPITNKWYGVLEKISSLVNPNNNPKVMKMLLDGELHMTVTGKPYRGKGLPGIKEVADKNQISKLCIITNDVFAKPMDNLYLKSKTPFSGTFVYWEIDQTNIYHEWTIKS